MKKDNVLGIIVMGCGLLLALSVFLPYISFFSTPMSLWKLEDSSRYMYILLGLFVIVLYLINKKTEMAYLVSGYGTFNAIAQIISLEGFEGLSIGFYLILLVSIAIGVITFIYDESKADALINFNKNTNNQPVVREQNVQTVPVGFDPVTGQPIYSNQNNN